MSRCKQGIRPLYNNYKFFVQVSAAHYHILHTTTHLYTPPEKKLKTLFLFGRGGAITTESPRTLAQNLPRLSSELLANLYQDYPVSF